MRNSLEQNEYFENLLFAALTSNKCALLCRPFFSHVRRRRNRTIDKMSVFVIFYSFDTVYDLQWR